jgi:probable F420-dependent oxidoreductase
MVCVTVWQAAAMKLGVAVFGGYATSPARLGPALEERGLESLFYAEHTHIPVASRRDDGQPTRDYAETADPFVALAMAASTTSALRLGTAVCLVPERDPLVTAKVVASLDMFSGGRVLFGVGAGWNRPELANHGTDPRARMAVLAERVQAMCALWTQDEAEYHGRYVDFDPVWSWPKPVQRPHPPVLVGGNGPTTEDRVLAYGDGWLPQCGRLASVAELRERAERLWQRAAEAGRGRIPITVFGVPEDRALLTEFAEIGVDRCLFLVQDRPQDRLLATLDRLAELAAGLGVTGSG